MRPSKLFNETYKATILFYHNCSYEEMRTSIRKKYYADIEPDNTCAGKSIQLEKDNGGSVFIFWINSNLKASKRFGVFVHEAQHITNFILSSRDVKICIEKNDEAQAYLIGWLAEKCFNKLK